MVGKKVKRSGDVD